MSGHLAYAIQPQPKTCARKIVQVQVLYHYYGRGRDAVLFDSGMTVAAELVAFVDGPSDGDGGEGA